MPFKEKKNIYYLKILIFFLILVSYFYGFYIKENIAGGAEADFRNLTWKGILSFKNNFIGTIYIIIVRLVRVVYQCFISLTPT